MDVVTKLTLTGHSNYEQFTNEVAVYASSREALEQILQSDLEMNVSLDEIEEIILLEEGLNLSNGRQSYKVPAWELDVEFDDIVEKVKTGMFKLAPSTLYISNEPSVAYRLAISEVPNEGQYLVDGQHILKPGYVWFAY